MTTAAPGRRDVNRSCQVLDRGRPARRPEAESTDDEGRTPPASANANRLSGVLSQALTLSQWYVPQWTRPLRHEHAPGNMLHAPVLFGVERSEQSVFIQIFVNIRPREQKQKLYQQIVENLVRNPGVRREDIDEPDRTRA
jgi:hypothetical protein